MFIVTEEQKKKIVVYLEFIFFYLLVFGVMLNKHYSIDSYSYSNHSTTAYIGNLGLGRIGNYFVFGLLRNVNIITYERFFTFLLIIVLGISSGMLYNHYKKYVWDAKGLFLLKIAVAIMYGNVFMVDYFNYIEMVLAWSCGILFMTVAVMQIKENMSLSNMLLSLVFMTISLSFYQALIGFFVYFALVDVYMIHKGKLALGAFLDSIKVLFCGGSAGVLNIVVLKVLQKMGIAPITERTGNVGIEGIWANIRDILKGTIGMLEDNSGFLPRHSTLLVLGILCLLIMITLLQSKAGWMNCLYIVLLVVACRSVLYLPHLLASTVWMAPRSIISYWSLISMPCIILVTISENIHIRRIGAIAAAIFLMVNAINVQKICVSIIATNRLDEAIAYMIQDKIEQYENESGQEVRAIAFKNDASPTWKYCEVEFQAFELCQRVYTAPWGCVESINFYNKEDYEYVAMDEETYAKYFDKADWDKLNLDEQLVFEGDTAYYVVY